MQVCGVCRHSESIAGAGLTICGLARARVVAAGVVIASEGERSGIRAEHVCIQVNKRMAVLPSRAKLCTGLLGGGGGVRGHGPKLKFKSFFGTGRCPQFACHYPVNFASPDFATYQWLPVIV
jgi:hypothetical protein